MMLLLTSFLTRQSLNDKDWAQWWESNSRFFERTEDLSKAKTIATEAIQRIQSVDDGEKMPSESYHAVGYQLRDDVPGL